MVGSIEQIYTYLVKSYFATNARTFEGAEIKHFHNVFVGQETRCAMPSKTAVIFVVF